MYARLFRFVPRLKPRNIDFANRRSSHLFYSTVTRAVFFASFGGKKCPPSFANAPPIKHFSNRRVCLKRKTFKISVNPGRISWNQNRTDQMSNDGVSVPFRHTVRHMSERFTPHYSLYGEWKETGKKKQSKNIPDWFRSNSLFQASFDRNQIADNRKTKYSCHGRHAFRIPNDCQTRRWCRSPGLLRRPNKRFTFPFSA